MMRAYSDSLSRQRLHSIRTPEGVVFSFVLAGVFARIFALILDMALIILVASTMNGVLMALSVISPDLAMAVWLIAGFALSICYPMIAEWGWRGQTVGKRIMRIRVMDEDGLRLKFSQVFIRNVVRFADMLPAFYMIGGLAAVVTSRSQRLGDLAAGTIVIAIPETGEPDFRGILAGKFNTFRGYPHIAARLRQGVSPAESGLTLAALLRREELDPDARVALFGEFRAHYEAKVSFPAEATQGLSDEQYVRNVVDILYR
jgi:uncharacterized RDD family membrane protein YckC